MTDRKPALKRYSIDEFDQITERTDGILVLASDLPPAILTLTAPELAAVAVFAEAMPELLDGWDAVRRETNAQAQSTARVNAQYIMARIMSAAIAAAKEAEHE